MQLEKTLETIAGLVHEAYLAFRENTFDTPFVKIEETDKALLIYDAPSVEDYFVTFPHHVVGLDERVKTAAVCMMACQAPYAWMYEMLLGLIQG